MAVRQQEIQRDRSDVETKTRLQEHDQEISQDEPVIQLSTRTSTSSWYSEDDDQYIPMPYEQIVEASLAERKCCSHRSSQRFFY